MLDDQAMKRRRTVPIVLLLAFSAGSVSPSAPETPLILKDRWGREVQERGLTLVDWDGYIANPAIGLSLAVPEGLDYPVEIYLHGTDPRIHFDRSDSDDRTGIGKRIRLATPQAEAEFRMSIFPDRDGLDEQHELIVQIFSRGREVRRARIPVRVVDRDVSVELASDAVSASDLIAPRPHYPVHVDFTEDRSGLFSDPMARQVVRQAAEDWAFFISPFPHDLVPPESERLQVWNVDGFQITRLLLNPRAFRGYLLYATGIHHDEMRAGGAPSWQGGFHSHSGENYPLKRSGTVEFDRAGNWNRLGWFRSLLDRDWWVSGSLRGEPSDLYSIAVHEIGHALAFHPLYPVIGHAMKGEGIRGERLEDYLGGRPLLDASVHLVDTVDPVSLYGAFGMEYQAKMKARRWLITKAHLLCLEAVGYPLRKTSAFESVRFRNAEESHTWPAGRHSEYLLPVVGGVPGFRFRVVDGGLPPGLSLDEWSGIIRGSTRGTGRHRVEVEVDDSDLTTPAVRIRLDIAIS
jgi:hypothetical protein